jgi:small subunit ribosomal protein S18
MAFKPKGKLAAKGGKGEKGRSLFKRRKFCRFTVEKIEEVDYKDVEILKDFIAENARIMPARITGHQNRLPASAVNCHQACALFGLDAFY